MKPPPRYVTLLTALLLWQAAIPALCNAGERPNVLFIAIDDLNDWVGCLGGHPQAVTPHMDALARRGVLFTNAHCQGPICGPSRASLLSDRYPHSMDVYQQPTLMELPGLPAMLRNEGRSLDHLRTNGVTDSK